MKNECLNCIHWKRNADGVVGICLLLNELRFQHKSPASDYCFEPIKGGRKACEDRLQYTKLPFDKFEE